MCTQTADDEHDTACDSEEKGPDDDDMNSDIDVDIEKNTSNGNSARTRLRSYVNSTLARLRCEKPSHPRDN